MITASTFAGALLCAALTTTDPFPAATPESQGLSAAALDELTAIVQGWVDDDTIVGAELLIVKNRHTVLHEAFGLDDRADAVPMVRNTLFNIRSMTKPMTGTITQMLADEGRLSLSDRVAGLLPSFDQGASSVITVEQLVTHRSGLPLTVMSSWSEFDSLAAIADRACERGPQFEPGSEFQYSDAGSDVLGRVNEIAGGALHHELLEQRLIEPLGMADTVTLIRDDDDPRRTRIAHAYLGTPGSWEVYWSPDRDPLYAFGMGSQSVYATPVDYARFLELWLDGGVHDGRRLLSEEAVARALTPVSASPVTPTSLRDIDMAYGQMWILWIDAAGEIAVFGHSGSDGTFAWVWPPDDLMVLYFTQSRGQASGVNLEREIDRLLLHPELYGHHASSPELAACTGWFHDPTVPYPAEFEVLQQDGGLALRLPQSIVSALEPPGEDGRWGLALDPNVSFAFVRDDSGSVTGLALHAGPDTIDLRPGRSPAPPPLDLDEVGPLLGLYRDEQEGVDVEVLLHEGKLAVKTPVYPSPLTLYPPDADGIWMLTANPIVRIRFDKDADGRVTGYTAITPAGNFERPRLAKTPDHG